MAAAFYLFLSNKKGTLEGPFFTSIDNYAFCLISLYTTALLAVHACDKI